jgi:hypothetical protein
VEATGRGVSVGGAVAEGDIPILIPAVGDKLGGMTVAVGRGGGAAVGAIGTIFIASCEICHCSYCP